jgi:hypothetical protein
LGVANAIAFGDNCFPGGKPQGNPRDGAAKMMNIDRGIPAAFVGRLFVFLHNYFTIVYACLSRPRLAYKMF